MLFIKLLIINSLLLLAGCVSNNNDNQNKISSSKPLFTWPDIPEFLNSEEDRINYVTTHYWDKFDFTDTIYYGKIEQTEQIFADYITMLLNTEEKQRRLSLSRKFSKLGKADDKGFYIFTNLYEKYLYNPNSPARNEDVYIDVLEALLSTEGIKDENKIRYQKHLTSSLRNRPGTIASDFVMETSQGKKMRLSEFKKNYTLLFFNNPGCDECEAIKKVIEINNLSTYKNFKIIAVYPDEDISLWQKTEYPKNWINTHCRDIDNLYDLRAIPTLYLLGPDNNIILKDAEIEDVLIEIYEKLEKL